MKKEEKGEGIFYIIMELSYLEALKNVKEHVRAMPISQGVTQMSNSKFTKSRELIDRDDVLKLINKFEKRLSNLVRKEHYKYQ